MSTLVIDLPQRGGRADSTSVQKIAVSHIAARKADISVSRRSLRASPGIQLIIPVDASVNLLVGSELFRVPQGMALVTDGQARKTAKAAAPAEDSGGAVATADLRIIELNALINDNTPLRDQLALPILLDCKPSDIANSLFDHLTTEGDVILLQSGTIEISRHLAAARLLALLLKSAGKSPQGRSQPPPDEQLAQLKQFLFANMAQSVTNPVMANHLGMSRSAFCQWARTYLDCSPARYLRLLRLERAQEWLAQGESDIEQIAQQTGFSDRYHFGKEFRKRFGLPPAQYAKMCREGPKEEFLARATERLFHLERYDEALATCEQALRGNPPRTIRDRLRYQKGLCLQALDRTAEAIAEWNTLRGSTMSHRAGLQQCRQLFDDGKTVRGLDVLRELYAAADGIQKTDLIGLWKDHFVYLMVQRLPRPLRFCLAVREELFPDDLDSMGLTGQVLYELGEEEEALTQCAQNELACFFALRRTGRLDEALARYGEHRTKEMIAISLHLTGRDEEVIASEPQFPEISAKALTALGRAEEAIKRYPNHCACAYLAMGRYQELLERFTLGSSKPMVECVYALHALGKIQKLKKVYAQHGWHWSLAQFYARPEAIPAARNPAARQWVPQALCLIALRALREGKRSRATATLEQIQGIRDPDLWWEGHTSAEVIIVSLLRGFLGDRKHLREDLQEIVAHHKFKDKQELWHDAAYLNGTITAAGYRRQPQQQDLANRFTFIQAVDRDLKGRRTAAPRAYRAFTESTQPYPESNLLRHEFAAWRLQPQGHKQRA